MLFQNVNEIKAILPIGVGNDFNRLKPHIENAEIGRASWRVRV